MNRMQPQKALTKCGKKNGRGGIQNRNKIMTVENKDHKAKINSTIATPVLIQQSNHMPDKFKKSKTQLCAFEKEISFTFKEAG